MQAIMFCLFFFQLQGREISHYGGYAYDAVWVYALALDELLKENKSNIATLHSPKTAKYGIIVCHKLNSK